MAKTTHKQKVKMARGGMTREEVLGKHSIWDTKFWNDRKKAIAERVKRKEARRAKNHV